MFCKVCSHLSARKHILYLWAYLGFICTAESIIATISPYGGVFIHVLILLALYLHAAYYSKHTISKLYLAFSLVPLCRIVNLSIPGIELPPFYWYPLVGVPLWAAVYLLIKRLALNPMEMGLRIRQVPLQLITGCCLGVPLGILSYLIFQPVSPIPGLEFPAFFCSAVVFLVFIAFLEEFIFRGILYQLAAKTVSPNFSMVFSSLAYGSLHIIYLSFKNMLLVLVASFVFIWLVKHFKSLLSVTLAHGIAVIGAYLIWPFYYNHLAMLFDGLKGEVMGKMVSIYHGDPEIWRQWNEIVPMVVIFLVILLIFKELAFTATVYSAYPRLYPADAVQSYVNIGLVPLLYVFALNILVKLLHMFLC